MPERVLFTDPDRSVFISNRRIIIDGKTYQTSTIYSAASFEKSKEVGFGYETVVFWTIMAVVCFLILDLDFFSIPIGLLSIFTAINCLVILNKKVYVLLLDTIAGEKQVLTLQNQLAIERMVEAINRAIKT